MPPPSFPCQEPRGTLPVPCQPWNLALESSATRRADPSRYASNLLTGSRAPPKWQRAGGREAREFCSAPNTMMMFKDRASTQQSPFKNSFWHTAKGFRKLFYRGPRCGRAHTHCDPAGPGSSPPRWLKRGLHCHLGRWPAGWHESGPPAESSPSASAPGLSPGLQRLLQFQLGHSVCRCEMRPCLAASQPVSHQGMDENGLSSPAAGKGTVQVKEPHAPSHTAVAYSRFWL